ncbi:hypothetical protein POM88_013243 [Heracleum sosnowskyi]|uniref:Uncharacterized protein n=1 Tax=Heracleum sosnowskyi TaxID=360622 RepID=A0AAD8N371_9APIA|nr:hypothetical protein POM88_013243 [Heracleum sosnowskyi]
MKRLSEMENALRKASGQMDRANAAVRRLETENADIRAEMEASKLSASESVLKFNLTESGLLCVLPWLTMAFSANLGGWIADTLMSRGFSVTSVRKGGLPALESCCRNSDERRSTEVGTDLVSWSARASRDRLVFRYGANIARGVGELHAAGVVWGRYCSWTVPCSLRTTLLQRHGSQ